LACSADGEHDGSGAREKEPESALGPWGCRCRKLQSSACSLPPMMITSGGSQHFRGYWEGGGFFVGVCSHL